MTHADDWGPIWFIIQARLGLHFGTLTWPRLRATLRCLGEIPGNPVMMVQPQKEGPRTFAVS